MRSLFALLFATITVACAQTQRAEELLVGKFSFSSPFPTPERTISVALDCGSTTDCLFSMDGSKAQLEDIAPLAQFDFAQNAVECHRRRDSSRITNRELLAEQSKLEPMLASGAKLEKCWDLNYSAPTFALACAVDREEFRQKILFLFMAAPWSRGEGACG